MKLKIFLVCSGMLIGGLLREYTDVPLSILLLSGLAPTLMLAGLALPEDDV